MCSANFEQKHILDDTDLFDYFWNCLESWVEEPNARRKGSSGVIRTTFKDEVVYIKKQVNHLHYSFRHPLGRPTGLREAEAIGSMKRLGIMAPDIIYCESRKCGRNYHTILVTKELTGYQPLEEFVASIPENDQMAHHRLIREVAKTIALIHHNRWQHSSLYAKHIFATEQNGQYKVALIDLEKMRRRFTAHHASSHELDQFSRHQKCWNEMFWQKFLNEYQNALKELHH